MELVLFYAPNTCALVPYVTLTEAGADFQVRPLNFARRQHLSPEYLLINPKHKVPVLSVDGELLSENVAIQIWIARNFPRAALLPLDPWLELKAISLLSWCASNIHPLLSRINNPAKCCDLPGAEESVRKLSVVALFETLQIGEDWLAGRQFFFDRFTAADVHFFWSFRRAIQFELELSRFRNCRAHFERVASRASVQKVFTYEKEIQAAFARVRVAVVSTPKASS